MDKPGFTPDLRQTLFGALTGRAGEVTGRPDGDLRGMLQAAFGEGRRPGGVNTRAAAESLGVTQRTVQRWLAGAGRQRHRANPEHLRAIAARARQAATTQRGRRAALGAVRQGPLPRHGARLTIRGEQGPSRAGRDYRRFRKVDLMLSPEDVDAALSAYERGGDRGFVTWLEGHADQEYVNDWGFDRIENLEMRDPNDTGG
jgi:hypothetical protein